MSELLRVCRAVLFAAAAFGFTACTTLTPSVVDARGPAERGITGLWWLMLWISSAVFAVVGGLLLYGIVRGRRRSEDEAGREPRWGEPFIVIAGVVVSGAILVFVFVLSLREMQALAAQGRTAGLVVHVIAHDWWWEARYPNGAVTANEIHIPTGTRVRLRLETADVIHSFWVPQLGPKRDTIPGRANELWIQADEPGRYRGQCAEFCGLQHAHMGLWVFADPPDEFRAWMSQQAEPARRPSGLAARGERVFLTNTCVGCHAIRGTAADGRLGPDLTHLASRTSIASAALPNTPAVLASWIADPQDAKPGVSMPPTELSAEDLAALVTYLVGLR